LRLVFDGRSDGSCSVVNAKALRLAQVDALLQPVVARPLPSRPAVGWLRTIREALGMGAAAVARRLEITASGVRKLEQAEAADAITLATLRRMAEALDCELQYVLVPRRSLSAMRFQQALKLAKEWQQRAGRTMALEDQAIEAPSASTQQRLEAMAQEILDSGGARLWP
jgi:predicted DNA-binding mobile mystery protein A